MTEGRWFFVQCRVNDWQQVEFLDVFFGSSVHEILDEANRLAYERGVTKPLMVTLIEWGHNP